MCLATDGVVFGVRQYGGVSILRVNAFLTMCRCARVITEGWPR